MSPETLLAAALFALVSSFTPGPNNAMLLASGVNYGFRRSQQHMWGVNLGFTFMVLCVGLGLHTVLERFPSFYDTLRYAGAAYMLWIAWKIASAAPAPANSEDTDASADSTAQPMGFWAAAAFQWVNPKAWVMAVTCMSTYLAPNAGVEQVALLAGIFMVMGAPCSAFWVAFGQGMRSVLQDPRRLRIFNVTMALALIASLYPMLMT